MNTDELNAAAQKLIEEANTESAAALASYEEDCLRMRFRLLERGTYRSSILSDALHELRADYDAQVLRIQKELDESLEALYAEAQEPEEPGGEEPGGEEPGGEEPGGEEPGGEEPDAAILRPGIGLVRVGKGLPLQVQELGLLLPGAILGQGLGVQGAAPLRRHGF